MENLRPNSKSIKNKGVHDRVIEIQILMSFVLLCVGAIKVIVFLTCARASW